MLKNSLTNYSSLWKAFIRPARAEYNLQDLGPPSSLINGIGYFRKDYILKNKRGLALHCSFFE